MEMTNHATPTTANGMPYFLPITTFTVGQTSPQKVTAAQISGNTNAQLTPHNTMRTTVIIVKLFFNNVIKVFINTPYSIDGS